MKLAQTPDTFKAWMKAVDETMFAVAGVTSADIDDFDFAGAFADSESARGTARTALRSAGFTGTIGFGA